VSFGVCMVAIVTEKRPWDETKLDQTFTVWMAWPNEICLQLLAVRGQPANGQIKIVALELQSSRGSGKRPWHPLIAIIQGPIATCHSLYVQNTSLIGRTKHVTHWMYKTRNHWMKKTRAVVLTPEGP
jgi:hypothetical protein